MKNRLICRNKECSRYGEEQFLKKVRWKFNGEKLVLMDNTCPICKKKSLEYVESEEKLDFKSIMITRQSHIKGGPPKKGDKFIY